MKDSRIGESLWSIWDGEGYTQCFPDSTIYYTEDHVDLEEDVVKRALASSIQRDGLSYSLGLSFRMVETSIISLGWVGALEGERHLEICDPFGETLSGDKLNDVVEVTFVEVPQLD
jgi:hypothetical protein